MRQAKEVQVSAKWEQGAGAPRRRELAQQLPSGSAGHRWRKSHLPDSSTVVLTFLLSPVRLEKRSVTAPILPHLATLPEGISEPEGSLRCSEPLHGAPEAGTGRSSGSAQHPYHAFCSSCAQWAELKSLNAEHPSSGQFR